MPMNTHGLLSHGDGAPTGTACDEAVLPYLGIFPKSIGFTGTREGMTDPQMRRVESILRAFALVCGGAEFHHGDCVGADAQAAAIANAHRYNLVAHPPVDPKLRAYFPSGVVLPEKDYLERNADIVQASHVLVAAPRTGVNPGTIGGKRSGTWFTILYAKDQGNPFIVIGPEGEQRFV